ncbi:probable metal-nicotianamine transporter YSL7 [Macadamia integrifolia]|uniref:probable metal-nicotianamine transporter YSL7 n=1 Tax=Macadamia integrifolia TaxID=60698 RepID=UPI001C4EB853|nr:probable metal-nicotianamine transporter YSL7 [Macadamia integrifolia]
MENRDDDVENISIDHEGSSNPQLVHRRKTKNEQEEEEQEDGIPPSVEQVFENTKVPSWKDQLTVRAFVVSLLLSVLFSFIVMKLNLTTGIIPSLNVSAGLLGFIMLKTWTKLLEKAGMLKQPFTRQENTVIQTCIVASSGIAFSGGFGSYLLGMSGAAAKQAGEFTDAKNIKDPQIGWMIGFLFVVSFIGLFSVVPLRKIMIIDFKLIYPSGTATAHLINSFHTPSGAKLARKQVKTLSRFFSFSFLWGFFQWFFTGGDDCGFAAFPSLGLEAYARKFYFDFSAVYVGVGMICPYIINISVLAGGVLSWGVLWPIIESKKGVWYSAKLKPTSLHGVQGYRVFISIAMILGDGLYNFVKVLSRTIISFVQQSKGKNKAAISIEEENSTGTSRIISFDDERRKKMFIKDQIPSWFAVGGYVGLAVISTIVLPFIFHPLKWYYILVIYVFAPVLAFCNSYGCGLTDWSLASTYGKLAIFAIGSWAGASHGGILAGLAACGVMMNIVSTASDLSQDFKTGYLTLASPRAMFVSQVIGTAMGCVISPCVFLLFYKAFPDLGQPESAYPAPFGVVYRSMAMLGVEGFSALPAHCLEICYGFFALSIVISGIKDCLGKKWSQYIPIPMAMAIPFYLGSYFAIDMCIGSLILFVWEKSNKRRADAFAPAVASGLICGDGIWSLPAAVLALAKLSPPICMKFLSSAVNAKVDTFLNPS